MKVEKLIINSEGVPVNSPNLILVSHRMVSLGAFWPGRFGYYSVTKETNMQAYLYAKGALLEYALLFWFWLENTFWNGIGWLFNHNLLHLTVDEGMKAELKNFRFGRKK